MKLFKFKEKLIHFKIVVNVVIIQGKLKTAVGIVGKVMKKNIAHVLMKNLNHKMIVLNVVMKKQRINVIDMVA